MRAHLTITQCRPALDVQVFSVTEGLSLAGRSREGGMQIEVPVKICVGQ